MKRLFIILATLSIVFDAYAQVPVMLGYTEWKISGVGFGNDDFSGLDFNVDSTRFVGVFNSAGVYWLDIPQEGDTLAYAEPLLAMDETKGITRDLEAVCVDRSSGDIYLGQERVTKDSAGNVIYEANSIYRLEAPEYINETLVASFDTTLLSRNNCSIEGLAIANGGHFILGREGSRDNPKEKTPALIEYDAETGTVKVQDMPDSVMQVADVVFDKVRNCFWITDSDFRLELYLCDLDGNVITAYPIPFIANPEAICIDRVRGCIWIGSDESPSKLYQVKFEDL